MCLFVSVVFVFKYKFDIQANMNVLAVNLLTLSWMIGYWMDYVNKSKTSKRRFMAVKQVYGQCRLLVLGAN